jgi:hypothetical protein
VPGRRVKFALAEGPLTTHSGRLLPSLAMPAHTPKRPLPTQDGNGSVGWIIDVPQRFGVGLAQFVRKRARKDGTRENASCRAAVSVPSIRTTPAAVGNGNSRRGKLGQSKW